MNVSCFIQGLMITGIGLGVGIFMAFIMIPTERLNKWVVAFPQLNKAYDIIHRCRRTWCRTFGDGTI
jgi:hypothetical protein